MPIEFSDIGKDDKWAGSDWTVIDPDDLSHHIARGDRQVVAQPAN